MVTDKCVSCLTCYVEIELAVNVDSLNKLWIPTTINGCLSYTQVLCLPVEQVLLEFTVNKEKGEEHLKGNVI